VHHPDRHSSKPEIIKTFHERRFKDIGEAYGILSDEPKRLLYDKGLLNRSIPSKGSHSQQNAHFATNISNVAMQNAAFWATVVQQQQAQARQTVGGAAARLSGASRTGFNSGQTGAGLAGATPFLFVPPQYGAAQAAMFRNAAHAQFANIRLRYPNQSHYGQNPYGKF